MLFAADFFSRDVSRAHIRLLKCRKHISLSNHEFDSFLLFSCVQVCVCEVFVVFNFFVCPASRGMADQAASRSTVAFLRLQCRRPLKWFWWWCIKIQNLDRRKRKRRNNLMCKSCLHTTLSVFIPIGSLTVWCLPSWINLCNRGIADEKENDVRVYAIWYIERKEMNLTKTPQATFVRII